jgi:hypothetical protein
MQGQVPIIRAPRNTAASMVAKRVCDRLREHLLRSSTLSDSLSSSFQRPRTPRLRSPPLPQPTQLTRVRCVRVRVR